VAYREDRWLVLYPETWRGRRVWGGHVGGFFDGKVRGLADDGHDHARHHLEAAGLAGFFFTGALTPPSGAEALGFAHTIGTAEAGPFHGKPAGIVRARTPVPTLLHGDRSVRWSM
jgi:hypothetical protein